MQAHLVRVDEHHERVALARGVLLALQEVCNQLWRVRDQEVEIPEQKREK